MVGMSAPDGGTVEQYLDELYGRLRCPPREARRILAEAEDHLREAVTDGLAAGLTQTEAEEQAVSSFGSVRAVVRAHDGGAWRFPGRAVLFDLALAGLKLGGIGALAVAASGLVAAAMNKLLGPGFVGGTGRGVSYPAASCRWWLADNLGVHTCARAAVLENSIDAVSLRLAVGVLGLILLLCYYVAPRRRSRHVLRGSNAAVSCCAMPDDATWAPSTHCTSMRPARPDSAGRRRGRRSFSSPAR